MLLSKAKALYGPSLVRSSGTLILVFCDISCHLIMQSALCRFHVAPMRASKYPNIRGLLWIGLSLLALVAVYNNFASNLGRKSWYRLDIRGGGADTGAPVSRSPADSVHGALTDESATGIFREYSLQYVEMYGRQPPRGYDKWVDYATSRQCRLDKEAYAMMEDALAPFRENRPKTSTVRSAFQRLDSAGFTSIRNGSVVDSKVNGPINFSDFYFKKVSEFAAHVSDLDLIVNSLDEPRVWWPEHLPPELEKQIQNGSLEVSEAFAQHGCQATDELKKWRELHAFVAFPQRGRAILHELAPVVSFSGIPGCFADIRMPSHFSISEGLSHHGLCAPSAQENLIPWDEKIPKLYWRGSNTGSDNNAPREKALKFHRNRLIAWAKQHGSDKYNIGLTGLVQGDGQLSLELMGGHLLPRDSVGEAFKHKYLLVIDGNAAATRLPPFLCTSSLVFLVQGMDEWFYDRIKPWVHYIPVALDLSDLEERVQWALQNDEEAQAIVRRANRVMSEEIRQEDLDCYWFRFLLEYGSLMEVDA